MFLEIPNNFNNSEKKVNNKILIVKIYQTYRFHQSNLRNGHWLLFHQDHLTMMRGYSD